MEIYCVALRLYAEVYGKSCFFDKAVFLMYLYTLLALSFLLSSCNRGVLWNIRVVLSYTMCLYVSLLVILV